MTRDRFHIVALLALSLAWSCAREVSGPDSDGLVATMEPLVHTKASIADPVPGEQYGVFTWDDDTRIAIHTTTGNGTYVISRMEEKSADGKTATFRPRLGGTRDGYAIYPIEAADGGYPGVDGRELRVYWYREHFVNISLANWKERYTTFAEAPMAAVNDPRYNTLEFKHLGGIIRLHIDQIPSNTRYIRIRSVSPDPVLYGSFKVDMSGAKPIVTPVSGEVGNVVYFSFSNDILNGLDASNGYGAGAINNVVLNLPVPPGTYNALRVEAWRANYYSSSQYNQIGKIVCPPVTVACGQAVDVDVPINRYVYGVVLNPVDINSSGTNGRTPKNLSISTLLRPVNVPFNILDLEGTGLSGKTADIHMTCTTDDPSIAQVYVNKSATGLPQIYVFGVSPGTTTLHSWVRKRYYDEEIYGSIQVTVAAASTFSVISPTTSMDTGSTMNLTVSSIPEEAGDRTLDYTWQIVSRSGASDASIAWDKQKAVLTAGSEVGWVDINCSVSYNGSSPVTSSTLRILIGDKDKPDGTVKGLFKVADSKIVYFGRSNLYSTQAEPDKFRLVENQFDVLYSKDPNWSDSCTDIPYDFAEYDLFSSEVAETTFADPSTSPAVYWNNNDADSSTGWYTLSAAEWKYLLETRRATTVAGTADARFLRVRLGVHFGLVIFPDTYVHPVSVQAIPSGRINSATASAIDLRYEEWEDMERAGAVFLPAAGMFEEIQRHIYFYHNSAVSYWSRDRRIFIFRIAPLNNFGNNADNYSSPYDPGAGFYVPVRLVKDVF